MNEVMQGQYKIVHKSDGPLETSGLSTCSAISFIINDSHTFMAHIDAITNIDLISNKIISQFGSSRLLISDVQIWYGDGIFEHTSELTQKLIKKFTTQLGIEIEPCKEPDHDIITHHSEGIIECRKCGSKSGTLKIISHNYTCPYQHKVRIRYNVGFMETVFSHIV
jgi:hypothetical protein